jgi:hypothetical protein
MIPRPVIAGDTTAYNQGIITRTLHEILPIKKKGKGKAIEL